MAQAPVTSDLARSALAHIPATLSRDEWAKVAMALKSEWPDETGLGLFDAWSQTAGDAYDAKAVRDTWRSVKAGGGVTIGTLLHMAQGYGFKLPETGQAMPAPSPAELAQRKREQAERQAREEAERDAAHAAAADEAARLWDEASERGHSDYLTRKGVQAHGLRFADGWAVVPLRDAAGKLWSVQTIGPDGAKRFIKGGRKSGLWHLLGAGDDAPGVVLLAEGYATAASVHEATGLPVACAFDVGNLLHVAKALRALWPRALLVMAGDDDAGTAAKSGNNPGRDKAEAAAKAVRGLAVFPAPLPDGGSDFNDLHAAQGLDAVRTCIMAAIETHQNAPQAANVGKARGKPASESGDAPSDDYGFVVNDAGVWFIGGANSDGKRSEPEWICSRLDVVARTRDTDGGGWGYLLAFADPKGAAKQWAMPARMLAGDGSEYRATLLNMGLQIPSSPRARNLLTRYIQTRAPEEFATCTDRIGWHGRAFVLPRETVASGDEAERIVYQTDGAIENTFKAKGAADAWRERVASLCEGNSRLVFAVSSAFAGPLLRPAGVDSGGFHFRGDSSSGKTTALKVAASVWGGGNYLQRWRATDNGLESVAAQHSDVLLILDEFGQVEPRIAGETAYMLANEQGKTRSSRTGQTRPRLTWRLLFLSAGEVGLADHMAEGQKRARVGQEIRMVDIPADAGAGLGAFEDLHGHDGGSAFANRLTAQALAVHGAVGRAWLGWLVDNADGLAKRVRELAAAQAGQLIPEGASGQVERVAARFALVGAAGELATAAGLMGWAKGESEKAARACFNAWLAARGGVGNGEVTQMLRQVRLFLESHGEGRFHWWHRAIDDHDSKTLHRVGFRRMVGEDGTPIKTNSDHQREYGEKMSAADGEKVRTEFFITAEAFRSEVCKGFDARAVAESLREAGCLEHDKGALTKRTRLPGVGLANCYHVTPKVFELDV